MSETTATGLADSMTELFILRFVATIGAVALTAEFSPGSPECGASPQVNVPNGS
jgi:hypothetical protein